MSVPRCMSTQHPDNVHPPFFADHPVIQGEAEIREAYYAYSHLGCTEQMWDFEGKEVDAFVVKKLLSRYERYFRENRLGEDVYLTLRVPNPRVETLEAKVLLETLESIPRSYDVASTFYGENAPVPIFEVILPMTSTAAEVERIHHYYKEFVGGKESQRCHDVTVGEWLGAFHPDTIHVIPLIEERSYLLGVDDIVEPFVRDKDLPYLRVFLARSDPALNYGLISAVLLVKIALRRLTELEQTIGLPLYPILGAGSAPFRGNLRPSRVADVVECHPSVQTFTIQSAFKYDHPEEEVQAALTVLGETPRQEAPEVDVAFCNRIIDKVSARYAECVSELAPLINEVASYVPQRRARKLHIGLFGYSRSLEGREGIHLPRAIRFCSSLYSIGVPPEILGVGALSPSELRALSEHYVQLSQDMEDSLSYLCEENLTQMPHIIREEAAAARAAFRCAPDREHSELTRAILESVHHRAGQETIPELIERAGTRRKFLG
ncbi:MAG: phosphoenolpyruvate carboxylase [Candidatus Bipolaricaulota bacterium]|nr:MAG: phosphoenolpyruvate carboxylase [Candidatus Bipolaricaulota bacterium]